MELYWRLSVTQFYIILPACLNPHFALHQPATSKMYDRSNGNGVDVNPVPRTYVRGFGALPLQGSRNIHPRAYARGVLWYGVKRY